eukprot:5801103-Karenia_brevis.AAC.1
MAGSRLVDVQGPVGVGKSTLLLSLFVFYCGFCGNFAILTSQSSPCNKFAEDFEAASHHCCMKVCRVASHKEIAEIITTGNK